MYNKKGDLVVDQTKFKAQKARALLTSPDVDASLKALTAADASTVPAALLTHINTVNEKIADMKKALGK